MIDITKLTEEDKGRRIRYTSKGGDKVEIGRLKSWNDKYIFGVYNSASDDPEWEKFTGAATDPADLEWVERVYLSYDEAAALLPDGDEIHTFVEAGPALIGADWDRESVLELLKIGLPELAGEGAKSLGHGLVAFRTVKDGARFSPIFIQTREAESEVQPSETV